LAKFTTIRRALFSEGSFAALVSCFSQRDYACNKFTKPVCLMGDAARTSLDVAEVPKADIRRSKQRRYPNITRRTAANFRSIN
jgi:hypothetical protein